MTKSWSEMTPAERLAHRIATNRAIDKRVAERVAEKAVQSKKSGKSPEISDRQKAVRDELAKFEKIKASQGVDAAADFVRSRIPRRSE